MTAPPEVIPEVAKAAPEKKPLPGPATKTTLSGKYTTAGDKDAAHEGESREPERQFKADLKKYGKKLQEILGYEPDLVKKGKKQVDSSISTNIAPVGGDGHILLWKPDSEYGAYVSVPV